MQTWIWWLPAALLLYLILKPSAPAKSTLSPAQLRDWMAATKDLQLVDVRTPSEFAQGHLTGAVSLPLDSLSGRMKELDPKRPLALYCLSGSRSARALGMLLRSGYPEAKHLAGGISAWQSAGLPVTR